jgi:membrane-bound lytic murein transglycosylase A
MRLKTLLLLLLFVGCARAPIKEAHLAMRPIPAPQALSDDLDFRVFAKALRKNAKYLTETEGLPEALQFGPDRYSKLDYAQGLIDFAQLVETEKDRSVLWQKIKERYQFYEVYGRDDWGEVLITSYFTPVLRASQKHSDKYSEALYALPDDMVMIDFKAFADRFPDLASLKYKLPQGLAQARINKEDPSQAIPLIQPYYTREEISSDKVLTGRKLEIAYLDPVDAFFLHIQGSGYLEFEKGRMTSVGYAGQNGHKYYAIGRELLDVIPLEEMSMQAIEEHLRALDKQEAQKIMNKNPSYVFFKEYPEGPTTQLGTAVVDGRTIATDNRLFSKGALGYMIFEQPVFENGKDSSPKTWEKTSRFILDQDTGGAIRGPGRVDLYTGKGPLAKQKAGVMRNTGRLLYLAPKKK